MYNIAICDDDKGELEYVERIIEKAFGRKDVQSTYKTYTSAKTLLEDNKQEPFDLVFLDLDMPGINGMETAENIGMQEGRTEIVFVTNHEELVYKAYRFKAIGFVRKKFLEEEVDEIIDIFFKEMAYREQYLVFKDSRTTYKILSQDIMYMQSADHYVDVVMRDNRCVVRDSMNNIEKMYSAYGFIRIHARYIVNYKYIYSLEKNEVVLTDGCRLPMSRAKMNSVKQLFQYYSRR